MSRALWKLLYFVCLFVGLIIMAVFLSKQMKVVAYMIMAITLAGMIFCSYMLRCPGCGRWAGKRNMFAKYCPTCGTALDD